MTLARETNGNHLADHDPNMSIPLVGLKQFQPLMLNGNANSTTTSPHHNIEDLYAKVSRLFYDCVVQEWEALFMKCTSCMSESHTI